MQNFAEFIAENYRSSVLLTWNLTGVSRATATFTVDSVKVTVTFEQEPEASWRVLFEVSKGERSDTEVAHLSFAIFNGVFQAAEEFIEVREPELLRFVTKRDELARIYQTYLRRESETIERLGYKIEGLEILRPA